MVVEFTSDNLWYKEFGMDYDIPQIMQAALELLGFKDASWHNDTCPKFVRDMDGGQLQVWIDHPVNGAREISSRRYTVVLVDATSYGHRLLSSEDGADVVPFVKSIIDAQGN